MQNAACLFKALSEETRLRIMALLAHGELCVCDLMAVLGLPQSTISRHLASLRHAGLVEGRRQGVWMHYRLAGADGLRQELSVLLERHLPDLPAGVRDHQALKAHLESKRGPSGCSFVVKKVPGQI
jgi:ArsR family transcriptional regulator, arsenate/arsenite/antimonite-responsive transcriptional repressor